MADPARRTRRDEILGPAGGPRGSHDRNRHPYRGYWPTAWRPDDQRHDLHGGDPETVAAGTICHDTPTRCQARTRLYREGRLVEQGFAIERISDHLTEPGAMVWLDLRAPDHG